MFTVDLHLLIAVLSSSFTGVNYGDFILLLHINLQVQLVMKHWFDSTAIQNWNQGP